MKTKNYPFGENTIRCRYSYRGGGIEISLAFLGKKYESGRMTAYQNYLGGGMLGAIAGDCNLPQWRNNPKLVDVQDKLRRYFHELTNHSDDEWESATYEENQRRPSSAY